jgi:hypothetical protein
MTLYSPQSLGFHAWLSPSGELFRVEYWEHDNWMIDYLSKDIAEAEFEGWIRIGYGLIIDYHDFNPTIFQIIKLQSLGYVVEIYNGKWRYEVPQGDEWFDYIPYAKGSKGRK